MKSFSALFIAFFLTACGSSQPSTKYHVSPLMVIANESQLNQVAGQLSGSLTIYEAEGKMIKALALSFSEDEDGNTVVTSPVFDLTKSRTYRFVIVFLWNGIPISYVDTTQATANGDSTTISFSESMLVYAQDTTDANISASIADGFVPNLDNDGDGYSNFDEIRSGSNPNDINSVPQGPEFSNVMVVLSEDGTLLTITADVSDGHGILSVTTDFIGADYLKLVVVQQLSGASSDKTRKLNVKLNTLDAPVGELSLLLTAKNQVNRSATRQVPVVIPEINGNTPPIIQIETLTSGQIVGGQVMISAKAFDRHGVSSLTMVSPSSIGNTSSATDRFSAIWDTSQLSDGNYTLVLRATDSLGLSIDKSITVTVANGVDLFGPSLSLTVTSSGNPAQVFDIVNGEEVFGRLDLRVIATDPSNPVTLKLLSTTTGLGSDPTSTPTLYLNTLDTDSYSDGGTATLNFIAQDTKGNTSSTTYNLTVRRSPSIVFDVNGSSSVEIARRGNVTFSWKTTKTSGAHIKHLNTGTEIINTAQTLGSVTSPIVHSGIYRLTTSRTIDSVAHTSVKDVAVLVNQFALQSAGLVFVGEAAGDIAGFSVAGAGDVDGDGLNDLLIGATEHDDHRGAVYLIYGDSELSGTHHLSEVQAGLGAKILGARAGDRNGTRVFSIGDMNVDGKSDFAIGNYSENSGEGAVHLFYGKNRNTLSGMVSLASAHAKFVGSTDGLGGGLGLSVAGGRFSGSSSLDLLLGVPNPPYGRAYLFNGPIASGIYSMTQGNTLIEQDERVIPERFGYLGHSVANAGDLNQDGLDELFVGSYGGDSGGRAYLLNGSAVVLPTLINTGSIANTITGENNWYDNGANDTLGAVVSAAGDVNGDGIGDIFLQAGQYDGSRGAVYLFYGPAEGKLDASEADAKFIGEAIGDSFGNGLSYGDINGDGLSDLLIGAARNDSNGVDSGSIYIFYGRPVAQEWRGTYAASQSDAKIVGESAGDEIFAARFIGNFTGPESRDIAIGSRFSGDLAGKVYIIPGHLLD